MRMEKLYHIGCGGRVQRQEHVGTGHWQFDFFCTECEEYLYLEEVEEK